LLAVTVLVDGLPFPVSSASASALTDSRPWGAS